jgi:hypothetical protein
MAVATVVVLGGTTLSAGLSTALLVEPAMAAVCSTGAATFGPTGNEQCYTVPTGVTSLYVVANGANGSGGTSDQPGGKGAHVEGRITVTPGQTLYVYVGGNGGTPGGGYNGGGSGNNNRGGGGGGATDIRSTSGALNTRLLVAGGGGGAGAAGTEIGPGGFDGGAGGFNGVNGVSVSPGNNFPGGGGGTQSSGGAGGYGNCNTPAPGTNGSLGTGGNGGFSPFGTGTVPNGPGGSGGGGGGGGLYGGGGGAGYCNANGYGAGGGGGSSWSSDPNAIFTSGGSSGASLSIRYVASVTGQVKNGTTNQNWAGQGPGSTAYPTTSVAQIGSAVPTGTVTYTLHSSSTCSGSPLSTQTVTLSGGNVPAGGASSALSSGGYTYKASYSGDASYAASSSCDYFVVAQAQPSISVTAPSPVPSGAPTSVTSTLTGEYPTQNTTRTVTYWAYKSGEVCDGASVGSAVVDVVNGVATWNGFTPPAVGTYVVTASYSGDVNNWSLSEACNGQRSATIVANVAADTTPPVITITQPTNGQFFNGNVIAAGLAGLAPGDKDVNIEFFSGSSASVPRLFWLTSLPRDPTTGHYETGPISLSDGTYTVRAHQLDDAGNTGYTGAPTFVVDRVAPTVSDDVPTAWQNGPRTVHLTANDALAGVQAIYYEKGANPGTPTTGSPTYDPANPPTLQAGEKIAYFARDKASNASAVKTSAALKVDSVAPSTGDNVPAGWQNGPVTVTLTATDASSGVASTYYTTDGSAPTTSSATYDVANKPTLTNGKAIRYFSVDAAGNAETVRTSAAAKVDQAAPVITITEPVGNIWYFNSNPFSGYGGLTPGDHGVVQEVRFYTGSTTDESAYLFRLTNIPIDQATGYWHVDPVTFGGGGIYSVKVLQYDDAGNLGTASATFKQDGSKPVVSDDVPTTWQNGPRSVHLTASDVYSGVQAVYYETGTNPSTPTTGSPTYDPANPPTLQDGESIRYFATDNVGWSSNLKTSPALKVDTVAPSTSDDVPSAWVGTPVTVTLTATDAAAGVAATYYTTDGSTPTTSSATYDAANKPTLTNGKAIRYFSVDEVGNAENVATSAPAKVDQAAPSTSDDVPTAWQTGPRTVHLTASDAASGVFKTYYTTGSTPAAPTASSPAYDPANPPTLQDGESIRYFSVDNAGNAEAVKSSSALKGDSVVPTVTSDFSSAWVNDDLEITLTAGDTGGSGLAAVYYTLGATPATPDTSSSVYDPGNKPTLADGEKISFFAADVAGNHSATTTTAAARVDKIAPTTLDDVPTTWAGTPIAVTLTAGDGDSGVATTYYTTDGTPPTTGSLVYDPAAKPLLTDGERIKYFSTDAAGNDEAVKTSNAAKVDGVAPVTGDDVTSGWATDDVTVTLTASDAGSDVSHTYYAINGTPTTASTEYDPASKPELGDGDTISYFSVDVAGNVEPVRTSVAAQVDKIKPTTSDDVPTGWVADDVAVTFSTVDNGSGVDEVYYAIDGTPSTGSSTYDPAAKPVLHHGQKISYFAVDEAGNVGVTQTSVAAKVDKTAPSTVDDVPAGWVSDDVTVTLSASDPASGVEETRYAIDGTPTGSSPVYDPGSKPVLAHGQTISYFSVDEVGNAEAIRTSPAAQVDKAAPSVSDDVPAGWVADDVTVTLSASDPASGVEETRYAIDAMPTGSSPVYDPASKPVLENGQTISYFSVDEVGNASATKTSAAAKVDKTAPSTADDVPAGWVSDDVTVTLSASDSASGVDKVYFAIDGTPSLGSSVYDAGSKPVLENGQTISYFSVDEVGNAEAIRTSPAAKVDKAAPSVSDDVPAGWVADDVTVTLSASDPASGVEETRYAIDGMPTGSSPVYDPASKPVLENGQTISYFSVDEVGNASATKTSAAAQVDKAGPSVSDDVPSGLVTSNVAVTLTASDPESGVDKTRYAIDATPDGSSPVYDPTSKPVLRDGQTISYFSVDMVGNASAVATSGAAKVAPLCSGQSATILAVPGQVTTGTSGRDVIVGTTGADTINAGGGDDLVCAGGGDDTVDGGAGNDRLRGQGGADRLGGRSGADRLSGGYGEDTLTGGVGDDTLAGRADADRLTGGPGDDTLAGGGGDDTLSGGTGNDRLDGGWGHDTLIGGPGEDRLVDEAEAGTPRAREAGQASVRTSPTVRRGVGRPALVDP